MQDMDRLFGMMRGEPLPDALGAMDGAVMAGLNAGRARRAARRGLALACAVGAAVGLWGGLALPTAMTGRDDPGEWVLLGVPAAAPSHLLES